MISPPATKALISSTRCLTLWNQDNFACYLSNLKHGLLLNLWVNLQVFDLASTPEYRALSHTCGPAFFPLVSRTSSPRLSNATDEDDPAESAAQII
jgi:hypothetical protein